MFQITPERRQRQGSAVYLMLILAEELRYVFLLVSLCHRTEQVATKTDPIIERSLIRVEPDVSWRCTECLLEGLDVTVGMAGEKGGGIAFPDVPHVTSLGAVVNDIHHCCGDGEPVGKNPLWSGRRGARCTTYEGWLALAVLETEIPANATID